MTRPKGKRPVSEQNAARAKERKKARSSKTSSTSSKGSRRSRMRPDAGDPPATPRTIREAMASMRTASGDDAITPARKWLAIGVASVVATTGFWLLVFAVIAPELDNPPSSVVPWYILGAIGIPLAFYTLAWLSRVPGALRATAISTAVAAGVAAALLGIGLLVGTSLPLPTIAVFAFGAGGIQTLRIDDAEYLRPRLWAVVIAGIYSMVMLFVAPAIGISLATLFPFNALGLSDLWVDRRRAKRERAAAR